MKICINLLVIVLIILFAGCTSSPPESSSKSPADNTSEFSDETTETPDALISTPDYLENTPQGNLQMTPSSSAPVNPNLQSLIEKAKEDLAQRLVIPVAQINLVEATEVEWTDSSLDCPQPGMDYLQVITPGYRIVLEAGGQLHQYHTNRDTYFVYCENNASPLIPKP